MLTIINNAAVNIQVDVSFQNRVFFFFWKYTQEWVAGSHDSSI